MCLFFLLRFTWNNARLMNVSWSQRMHQGDISGFPHHHLRLSHKSLHCAWRSKQDGSVLSLYVCLHAHMCISHLCAYVYRETVKLNEYPLVTKSNTHTRTHTHFYCPFYSDQTLNKAVLLQTHTMKWRRMSCDMCVRIISWISMSRAGWVIFTRRYAHATQDGF